MQQPTCTNVRIRSTEDAHKIFRSIQQGLLSMVTRRLDADERLALRSGCVYAWEERGPHSEITGLGIERFTEGRRWSPSRVRDEFLFYYEKYSPPADVNNIGNLAERLPPPDWDQLIKQTYSVWVETDNGRRKWHLTAYYTQGTEDYLGTIDNISRVRDVVVTDGMFKSIRAGRRARADEANWSNTRVGTRTYAPFPLPYQQQGRPETPSTNPVLMHEPYQRTDQPEYFRDQVESSAPYSHPSPSLSPTSPTTNGQYFGDVPSYSRPSRSVLVRSNSNVDHPTNPLGGSLYHPTATSPQNYPMLSPPWANHDSYYCTRPVHIHSDPASPPSAPMSYDHTSQHVSPRPSNHLGTPSYSLESALTPPQSIPDCRGVALASLQIPHYTSATQCHTPPDSAIAMEDQSEEDQSGLAPLEELRRSRYRREPLDEKTLRLLVGQSTP